MVLSSPLWHRSTNAGRPLSGGGTESFSFSFPAKSSFFFHHLFQLSCVTHNSRRARAPVRNKYQNSKPKQDLTPLVW